MSRRKMRLIEDNAKFPHLKKFTCTGTLRQVFICLRLRIPYPPPPFTHCIRVYRILIHTGKGGGRFESERRKRGNSSQSWVESTNITDLYLHDKHLPQSLLFEMTTFCLVSIKLSSPWHESNLFLFSKERCPFF
jgi:hypothetical protein